MVFTQIKGERVVWNGDFSLPKQWKFMDDFSKIGLKILEIEARVVKVQIIFGCESSWWCFLTIKKT